MYNDLLKMYPGFSRFYEVNLPMAAAMNLCARLSTVDEHVVQYGSKVIYTTNRDFNMPELTPILP
jgi:hypothetical protein